MMMEDGVMDGRRGGGSRLVGRLWRLLTAVIVTMPVATAQGGTVATGAGSLPPVGFTTPPPTLCDGPRDLIVERGPLMLRGTHTFDRVCVRDGGTLVADGALTLRAGILDIAPHGAIDANGADGYEYDTHDCIGNDISPDGSTGQRLIIIARHAVVRGHISADGGLSYGPNCGGADDLGNGGAGGTVRIVAVDLALAGRVTARGGAGGNTTPSYPAYPPTTDRSGDGGRGGQVTLTISQPVLASMQAHLDARGGGAGAHPRGPAGKSAAGGSVSIRTLTAAEGAGIPADPPSPIAFVGLMPARQSLNAAFARSPALRCGTGDLVVRRGHTVALGGLHRYAHVCVEGGGVLVGRGSLGLVAQTIIVAAGGRIDVDGAGPLPFHWSDSGRYDARGACAATHARPHAGVRGPAGDSSANGSGSSDADANPGDGGGLLTLIARDVALDGQVSATGGPGQDGWYVDSPAGGSTPPIPFGGGGGGSGGGVYVSAGRLRLGGVISVAGGVGGHGLGLDGAAGPHGGPGCVKLFADVLQTSTDALPLAGPSIISRPSPADPVPPALNATYDEATGHNLGGAFLRFWREHGGLDALGAPLTDPFVEGGSPVQYTERALLQLVGGHVRLAPLGRQLTAGRAFTAVPPVASSPGRRYFPATGHSLSGRFLAYWRAHDGAAVLGAPISEVIVEGNEDGSGRRYPLQWFERGRLEYHAEHAGTRYEIQRGLLGVEALRRRGWAPPLTAPRGASPLTAWAGASPSIRLYAATRAGVIFGSDGSRQWRFLTGPRTTSPEGCSNVLSVATADHGETVYAGTCSGGVWRSSDGGRSWAEADRGLPGGNVAVFGLVVASDGRTVYAADEGGVFRTTDAGATWSSLFAPSEQDYGVEAVALDPRHPDHLWAGTEGSGLYRSEDAGRRWIHVRGAGFPDNAWIDEIAQSPFDSADVFVSTQDDVYHTRDGGAHWTIEQGPHVGLSDLTFDPLQPGRIYASDGTGEYVSRDDGVSWVKGRGFAGQSYGVVASHGRPGLAYLIGEPVVYRTDDGGASWQPWDGGDLRADDDVIVLAGDVR